MKKGRLIFLAPLLTLLLSIFGVSFAKAEVSGIVKDYFGNPIEGVQVKIQYSRLIASTDQNGKYSVEYIPGSFTVLYSKSGYSRYEISLNLATKETFPAEDVTLCKLPIKPGAYFFTWDGLTSLNENRIGIAGTYLQSISGIASLSGNTAPPGNQPAILLYGNRLSSEALSFSKLSFCNSALVQNVIGKTRSDINMWIPAEEVPHVLSKYEADQYLAVMRPEHGLKDGIYAISFGALHAGNPLSVSGMQKAVFDFQVRSTPAQTSTRPTNKDAKKGVALQEAVTRIENRIKDVPGEKGSPAGKQMGITIPIYIVEVETLIKNNWGYPAALMDTKKSDDLEALVVMKVKRNGSILDTWFKKKSGNPAFDQSVREAIEKSNPLPPFPEGYLKTHEDIELSFVSRDLEGFGSGSPNSGGLLLSQSFVLTNQEFEADQASKSYNIKLAEKTSVAVISGGPMDLKGVLRDQKSNMIAANRGYRDIGRCTCKANGAQQTPEGYEHRNFMLRAFDLPPGSYSIEVSLDEGASSSQGNFSLIFLTKPKTTKGFFEGIRALLGDNDPSNDYLDIYVKALFKEYYSDVNDIASVNYTDTLCFGGVGRERQCKALVNFYLKDVLGRPEGLRSDCEILNHFVSNDPDYLLMDPATTIYNSSSNYGNIKDAKIGDAWVKKIRLVCAEGKGKTGYNHYGLYCGPDGKIVDANSAGDGRLRFSTDKERNTGSGWKIARIKLEGDSMLQEARLLEEQGKYVKAIQLLKRIISQSPGNDNEEAQHMYLKLRLKAMEQE